MQDPKFGLVISSITPVNITFQVERMLAVEIMGNLRENIRNDEA
jgi:hypothetical protein